MDSMRAAKWSARIEAAASSGMPINEWCKENHVSKRQFYRFSKDLGYTANGKRTSKWPGTDISDKDAQNHPETACRLDTSVQNLVAVPLQTVRSALENETSELVPAAQPQIVIQYGTVSIAVGDGFSSETLRRVLEVVADA